MYNYFRQGWIVSRLDGMLEADVRRANPLVLNLPAAIVSTRTTSCSGEFTMLFAGDDRADQEAFARQPDTGCAPVAAERPTRRTASTLLDERAHRARCAAQAARESRWVQFRPTRGRAAGPKRRLATDDWPFLYLRGR